MRRHGSRRIDPGKRRCQIEFQGQMTGSVVQIYVSVIIGRSHLRLFEQRTDSDMFFPILQFRRCYGWVSGVSWTIAMYSRPVPQMFWTRLKCDLSMSCNENPADLYARGLTVVMRTANVKPLWFIRRSRLSWAKIPSQEAHKGWWE